MSCPVFIAIANSCQRQIHIRHLSLRRVAAPASAVSHDVFLHGSPRRAATGWGIAEALHLGCVEPKVHGLSLSPAAVMPDTTLAGRGSLNWALLFLAKLHALFQDGGKLQDIAVLQHLYAAHRKQVQYQAKTAAVWFPMVCAGESRAKTTRQREYEWHFALKSISDSCKCCRLV